MYDYGYVRSLLRQYDIRPKKSLGQNFAVDSRFLKRMTSYANVREDDVVLEVGAGLGFLTELIAKICKKVIAVEVDRKLVKALKERLNRLKLENVELIEGDILKVQVPSFDKVVSTPPYSISSPLLFWLFDRPFKCAVLTFQREFAERLNAPIGSDCYSRLTVMTYYKAEVELLDFIPREAFYPPPDVDSIIVRLRPRGTPPFYVKDEGAFNELVQFLFTQRNKKVRSVIVQFLMRRMDLRKDNALKLAESLPYEDKRVRELAPEDFGALINALP